MKSLVTWPAFGEHIPISFVQLSSACCLICTPAHERSTSIPPDSLWLEQSELPGRGSLSTKKKKYLWFKCRHISPKRLTSLFSQWILNVFDEGLVYSDKFNALWSRQNTVWAILTIWISYVRVKNRMNLIWKEKWHSVFARDKKQNNPPHNITLCFLPSAGCFVYIHAVYLHTAPPPHPNRFTHPHTHLQTQRGVDVWLMLSIFTFLAN